MAGAQLSPGGPHPHLTCLLAPPQGTWTRVRLVLGGSRQNVLHLGAAWKLLISVTLFNIHVMLNCVKHQIEIIWRNYEEANKHSNGKNH
ncbi:hypothetical protein E2C01_016881 [Portunus trituberculatus]|uniref:Uncharacterized protein n=1 Tax=Portunus trituberculatus TaxID=210409 RepID=A0A5B7DSB7_PORTR|nr:hypothetical protein [Portunus trituberculatus]